jgi:NitT/TauT family transport system substrate-binding protein
MKKVLIKTISASVGAAILSFGVTTAASAKVGFGKPGEPVELVIGYQPYYTESWSGVVINGQNLWKKHLPKGSSAKFEIGLQGSVIVGKLLGEKKSHWVHGRHACDCFFDERKAGRSSYDFCFGNI